MCIRLGVEWVVHFWYGMYIPALRVAPEGLGFGRCPGCLSMALVGQRLTGVEGVIRLRCLGGAEAEKWNTMANICTV